MDAATRARYWAQLLLLRCLLCGQLSDRSPLAPSLCADCAVGLEPAPRRRPAPGGIHVHAAFEYAGVPRSAIRALKFRDGVALGRPLGAALAGVIEGSAMKGRDLVPVPLHWGRRLRRGHNQAVGIAEGVARTLPGALARPLLRRRRATPAQVGLDRRARLANLVDAFVVPVWHRDEVAGRDLIVVDDVVTTGATLAAARAALLAAGAGEVALVAVAAADASPLARS